MAETRYCSRGDVKRALDSRETARNHPQIDRLIAAASRRVEALTHRKFYPEIDTRYFDFPKRGYNSSTRVWLDADELISITTITSGGTTISSSDYFLYPVNSGPPYTNIQIDLGGTGTFEVGDTWQKNIVVTGKFGHSDLTERQGSTAEVLDASETEVDITNSAFIDVGDIIKVDNELMIVTGRVNLDIAETVMGALQESKADVTVSVTDGTLFAEDEVIQIDSEKMLIVEITGNDLTVIRAWDGSALAQHSSGADIYAPRTLQVERGALGTTAAVHADNSPLYKQVPPQAVKDLTVALAVKSLIEENSGGNANVNVAEKEKAVRDLYGRKARMRTV